MKTMLCATSAALLLGACASNTPYLDSQFGQANRMLQTQQIILPQGQAGNPSAGVDGQVARSGYDQYQKTFRAPEPQTQAFTIGLGTGK
ncbi:pilus assembly protein [Rugamonas apoptosis]|uniref:Pilus assembly protein n=1 Tax=Rugamonas apoptosis TaxID=2758570 RepID=A0A7W2F762_9BURK|nr:pilus assembly protein [Rugamonas apoptosis]MBA5686219.1 pilus assembly protein [Rugamonas apoptosis]